MQQLGILLLVMLLVSSCAAQIDCKNNTKPKCRNHGGECQSFDKICMGEWRKGPKFCKRPNKCGCCIPPKDCPLGTRWPCTSLNGTCISAHEYCDGREVFGKAFCKWPNKCKCCFPGCDCEDARTCYQPKAPAEKYYVPYGVCRKKCHENEDPHDKCHIDKQDCFCCLTRKDCGRECQSPDFMTCICSLTNHCPEGYCHYDDKGQCPIHQCSCCKESSPTDPCATPAGSICALTIFCDSDGNIYNDGCAYEEAKCRNPELQRVPCEDHQIT